MVNVTDYHSTLKYSNLPDVLETKEDLYNLIVIASRKFHQPCYANRLATMGLSHRDLAHELILRFLTDGLAPKHRRVGKGTNPANDVRLPIRKNRAYATLSRDLLNIVRKLTPEEKARVELVPPQEEGEL
jgi:hypothetical protein